MKHKSYLDNIIRTTPVHTVASDLGHRLHAGERAIEFPAEQFGDFVRSLAQSDFISYPDESKLIKIIANKHRVSEDNVLLFAGADAAIKCSVDTLCDIGSTVAAPMLHFPMYDVYIAQNGGKFVPLHNIEKNDELRMIIVGNPNSPEGNSYSEDYFGQLERFNVPIIVDSVYEAFGSTKLDVLDKIQRDYIFVYSFSKSYGAAGCRVGYAISNYTMITKLHKMRPMYGVNSVGLKFAEWLLVNQDLSDEYVSTCVSIRNKMNEWFPYNIGGNWVHVPELIDSISVVDELEKFGFSFKRGCTLPGVDGLLIRATASQNFLDLIETIVAHTSR